MKINVRSLLGLGPTIKEITGKSFETVKRKKTVKFTLRSLKHFKYLLLCIWIFQGVSLGLKQFAVAGFYKDWLDKEKFLGSFFSQLFAL